MDQYTNGEKPEIDNSNSISPDLQQPQDNKAENAENDKKSGTELKTNEPPNNLAQLQDYPDIESSKVLKNVTGPSKTPVPQLSATNSMEDLRDIQRLRANLSKASLNFGSRSNISSICHMEEVSEGRASIDRQEYRLQRKRNSQTERDARSTNTLGNHSRDNDPQLKGQLKMKENPYEDSASRNKMPQKGTAVFKQ